VGLLDGLLTGFFGAKSGYEQQQREQDAASSAKEAAVFQTLLNSPDPEIQSLALTGMLQSAQPGKRKGGIRGWMGELEQHPAMGQMQALLHTLTPQQETVPGAAVRAPIPNVEPLNPSMLPQGGASEVHPAITTPPPQPSAALPATSPVQPGGGPPPAPISWTTAYTPDTTRTVMKPRQVFRSPEETYAAQARGKAEGDTAGDIAGYEEAFVANGMPRVQAHQKATDLVVQERLAKHAGSASGRSVSGEVPDGKGGWVAAFGVFDPASQTYRHPGTAIVLEGFRPHTSVASASWGTELEPLAKAIFGKRGVDLTQEEASTLLTARQMQKNQLTTQQALASASRMLPNASLDQQMALANYLRSSTEATAGPGATPAGGGQATTPPPTTPPPAPKEIGANLPTGFGTMSKETGKPLSPAVATTLARAKSTNDLIDKALAALEPFKTDNTLQGSINLAKNYRAGVYDPLTSAASQLSDLAGLQAANSQQLQGGASRAMAYFTARRQHVPRLPSGRQTLASNILGGKATNTASQVLKGDEAGFDSPQTMYEKLTQAKANNDSFIRELEAATVTKPDPGVQPVPSHAPTAPGTGGKAYPDGKGGWRIVVPPQ
jgi:hypothetical protein